MISTVWHYNSQTVKSRGIHWLVSTSARISLASNNNRNAAIFMQLKNPVAINVWLRFAIRHTNSNFCYIEWAIRNELTKKGERWSELFMETTDCTSRFELCKSCISFGIIKDEQKQAEHIVSRLTPVSYIPPASYFHPLNWQNCLELTDFSWWPLFRLTHVSFLPQLSILPASRLISWTVQKRFRISGLNGRKLGKFLSVK